MASNTNPKESAATAKLSFGRMTRAEIVQKTHHLVEVVKQHPDYANRPDVQQCAAAWEASTNAVGTDDQDIHANRTALKALLAKQNIDVATWKRTTKQMVAVIDLASAGSAEAIKKWGFDVNGRTTAVPSTDPPIGLRATYTKGVELVVRWTAVPGQRGYLVQMGDGTPANWGAPIQCPQARFVPPGLHAGQNVAFRVSVQRKNGLSAWSDVLVATAR